MLLEESLVPLLDRVLPDRPAMVLHVSSHGGVFNTAAQRLLGLERGALVENPFLAAQKRSPCRGWRSWSRPFGRPRTTTSPRAMSWPRRAA